MLFHVFVVIYFYEIPSSEISDIRYQQETDITFQRVCCFLCHIFSSDSYF